MNIQTQPLKGLVAVVTGASRGVGKGIALSLGEQGAIVYGTGRTGAGQPATVPLAGTIEDTAAEVTRIGGQGIAVQCDHRSDEQTAALFKRVETEQSHLDILVNCAWAGYEGLHDGRDFPMETPFWERRLSLWDDNLFGVRAAYIAIVFATRLMIPQHKGLIINISNYINSFGSPAYNIAKTATDRLAADCAEALKSHQITVVSLYPGLVRTEGIMKYADYIDLSNAESPQFTGRAVVALASDTGVQKKSGQSLFITDLAAEYHFTDIDGKIPRPVQR